MAKLIHQLSSMSNKVSSCAKLDAIWFKKYVGYMIKTNRMKNISETGWLSKALVIYLLDCYTFFDLKWYRPKLNARWKMKEEDSQWYYRCKKGIRNWSVLVSICDGSIFQKYVGPNIFTVKFDGFNYKYDNYVCQHSILLDPIPLSILWLYSWLYYICSIFCLN